MSEIISAEEYIVRRGTDGRIVMSLSERCLLPCDSNWTDRHIEHLGPRRFVLSIDGERELTGATVEFFGMLNALVADVSDIANSMIAACQPIADMVERGDVSCDWHPGYAPDDEPDWTNRQTTQAFLTGQTERDT